PVAVDIFRDPTSPARGGGRSLLTAARHAAQTDDLPSLCLVASRENTGAAAMDAGLGFVAASRDWTLALP
ncbi:MAG: hypothetical protein H0T17_06465, partial [Propionibacteriales bacterium]|nr:hypothetical protein [Propionibacteriales bacterium]